MFEDKFSFVSCENLEKTIHPHFYSKESDFAPAHYRFMLEFRPSKEKTSLIVEFKEILIINRMSFNVYKLVYGSQKTNQPFSYQVHVSRDPLVCDKWITIAVYSTYKCYSEQQLFFPKQAAQYVPSLLILVINSN